MFNKSNKKSLQPKEALREYFNGRVYFGPFSGLKVPISLYKKLSLTEIMGMYESCLHPVFSDLLNKNIKNIILVGGNYGYYTAGLSYIFNPNEFLVYEMEDFMHPYILEWYKNSNLKKPTLLHEANELNFKSLNLDIDFLFMDCEGAEVELLDPQKFNWQKNTNIVAELHPFYVDNLVTIIKSRFEKTHNIELIYDDFFEDDKVSKILDGLNVNIEYNKHPTHRWIIEHDKKVYTSGLFVYLKVK